jgi:hypothetical protein
MSPNLPILPLGQAVFEDLRKEQTLYVDKTMYLPEFRKHGKFIFCARPRRFGKSLLLTTLDAFFSGKSDLFRGLAVEGYMSSNAYVTRPVIHLDMARVAGSESKEILVNNIIDRLEFNAKRHNVSLRGANCANALANLLEDVHNLSGQKAVLLIDEYDDPVIRLIGAEKRAVEEQLLFDTRFVTQTFYSIIKTSETDIELAFITGVTKFSRMGVFSSMLNNLTDISIKPEFATLMGYTQQELETYFNPFIIETAKKLMVTRPDLLKSIKDYYDGFSFDGAEKVYNPYSTLSFFDNSQFSSYWMGSGSNTLVRKFLKDKAITADQFVGMKVSPDFARVPGEIDATPAHGFLYQSGYLTLRVDKDKEGSYTLDYPNLEVREGISKLFLENIIPDLTGTDEAKNDLSGYLAAGDIPGIVKVFRKLLAGVSYYDHLDANRTPLTRILKKLFRKLTGIDFLDDPLQSQSASLAEKLIKSKGENYYRSLLRACLWMAGAKVTPEKAERLGRIDLEAVYGHLTYVFELKMTNEFTLANAAVRSGMKQIHSQRYGQASKNAILVSIAIGKKERNVVGYVFSKDGHETTGEVDGYEYA